MTDEIQETEPQELGQPEVDVAQESESSPDSGENHEQKHNAVQERINKITREKYEAKREAEELRKQLEEAKQHKPEAQNVPNEGEPEYPDDPYDDDKVREYHRQMAAYNRKQAEKAALDTYKAREAEQQKQQQELQQKQVIDRWIDTAQKSGVDLDKLAAAEQTVAAAGVKPELAQYLMNDSAGPQMVAYLADNPAVMYEIVEMDAMSAAVKLATEIKAQALSSTPKVTKAPEPYAQINGGGVSVKSDFERMFPDAKII